MVITLLEYLVEAGAVYFQFISVCFQCHVWHVERLGESKTGLHPDVFSALAMLGRHLANSGVSGVILVPTPLLGLSYPALVAAELASRGCKGVYLFCELT